MPNDISNKFILDEGKFKLVFEEHPDYFFACVEGTATDSETVEEYQGAIAAEISKRTYDRVMIKRDVPLTNNSGQHCGVIYKVRGWEMKKVRYAFVDVNTVQLSSYKFALMYAKQLGIEAEVFSDISLAEEWLLKDRV